MEWFLTFFHSSMLGVSGEEGRLENNWIFLVSLEKYKNGLQQGFQANKRKDLDRELLALYVQLACWRYLLRRSQCTGDSFSFLQNTGHVPNQYLSLVTESLIYSYTGCNQVLLSTSFLFLFGLKFYFPFSPALLLFCGKPYIGIREAHWKNNLKQRIFNWSAGICLGTNSHHIQRPFSKDYMTLSCCKYRRLLYNICLSRR